MGDRLRFVSPQQVRFLSIEDVIGDWTWDLTQDTIVPSRAMAAFFGLDHNKEDHMSVYQTKIHPDDRDDVQDRFERFRLNYAPFSHECRQFGLDGAEYWTLMRGSAYFDDNRKRMMGVCLTYDVTDVRLSTQEIASEPESLIEAATRHLLRASRALRGLPLARFAPGPRAALLETWSALEQIGAEADDVDIVRGVQVTRDRLRDVCITADPVGHA